MVKYFFNKYSIIYPLLLITMANFQASAQKRISLLQDGINDLKINQKIDTGKWDLFIADEFMRILNENHNPYGEYYRKIRGEFTLNGLDAPVEIELTLNQEQIVTEIRIKILRYITNNSLLQFLTGLWGEPETGASTNIDGRVFSDFSVWDSSENNCSIAGGIRRGGLVVEYWGGNMNK